MPDAFTVDAPIGPPLRARDRQRFSPDGRPSTAIRSSQVPGKCRALSDHPTGVPPDPHPSLLPDSPSASALSGGVPRAEVSTMTDPPGEALSPLLEDRRTRRRRKVGRLPSSPASSGLEAAPVKRRKIRDTYQEVPSTPHRRQAVDSAGIYSMNVQRQMLYRRRSGPQYTRGDGAHRRDAFFAACHRGQGRSRRFPAKAPTSRSPNRVGRAFLAIERRGRRTSASTRAPSRMVRRGTRPPPRRRQRLRSSGELSRPRRGRTLCLPITTASPSSRALGERSWTPVLRAGGSRRRAAALGPVSRMGTVAALRTWRGVQGHDRGLPGRAR
jgi:hypothetical protein